MSATCDETARVYHCVVCGPIFRFAYGAPGGHVTFHKPLPHPYAFDLETDETLQ